MYLFADSLDATKAANAEDIDTTDPQQIISLTESIRQTTQLKISEIQAVTGRTRILALNALIESARAGDVGRGFAVVANEVKSVSEEIAGVAEALQGELSVKAELLERIGKDIVEELLGQRTVDLALNAVELIDRNLYERTCDVRWWATDSAVVECVTDEKSDAKYQHASKRLAVILSAYTVYLDLWVCDLDGTVVANGRPSEYHAVGTSVRGQGWFEEALKSYNGDEYSVADIETNSCLGGQPVATYAAAIRENGDVNGKVIGVLGIHFDWGPQAQAIVSGLRFSENEKHRSRALLLDANMRVIASSDGKGVLTEGFTLDRGGRESGHYIKDDGTSVGFHRTPGYETYQGLGWYGCIVQKPTD